MYNFAKYRRWFVMLHRCCLLLRRIHVCNARKDTRIQLLKLHKDEQNVVSEEYNKTQDKRIHKQTQLY